MNVYKYALIGTLLSMNLLANANHHYDSLRMEKIDGKSFIVHKVEPKETLFSISRRYGVKVNDILESNSDLENGLKMYQELFVPYVEEISKTIAIKYKSDNTIHIVQQGETLYAISRKYSLSIDEIKKNNDLTDHNISLGDTLKLETKAASLEPENKEAVDEAVEEQDSISYHIVSPSETLYAISLKYEIDIQDIRDWNNLTSNNLDVGQKLVLKKVLSDTVDIIKEPLLQPIDTVYVATDTTRFRTKKETSGNINKTVEEGFATKIERTEDTKKYLALHRNASIGTVIEVKNQMNNRSIFVRVVGKLPETGLNRNVLLRLSHAAYQKLGALDAKTPVMIGYVEE